LARSAAPVLAAAEALAATANALRAQYRPRVRLAASLTVAEHLLPEWLSRLRAGHPDLAIELLVVNSDRVIDLIRSGAAELGFIEGPEPPVGLASLELASD
jgi:DNA-binding transcriptional LysR family regulator